MGVDKTDDVHSYQPSHASTVDRCSVPTAAVAVTAAAASLLLGAGAIAAGTADAAADVADSSKRGRDEPAPYISTPMCACGAGPCNILKEAGSGRMYFACPDDVSGWCAGSCRCNYGIDGKGEAQQLQH